MMSFIRNCVASVGVLTTLVAAQLAGPAPIGLTAFTQADARKLADVIGDERKDTELAFLPFEFDNNNRGPFDRANEVVRAALPRLDSNDTLRITIYLYWADNHQLDWSDFRSGGNNDNKAMMRRRTTRTANFICDLRTWNTARIAAGGRRGGELKFTIVPMLEDNCANASNYAACLNLVRDALNDAGVRASSVNFRRSVAFEFTGTGQNARVVNSSLNRLFRVDGSSLEVHGNADAVAALNRSNRVRLERGDTFTNDGTRMTVSEFNSLRTRLASEGISALYWSQEYNGDRSINRNQRVLRPFTGTDGGAHESNLRNAM